MISLRRKIIYLLLALILALALSACVRPFGQSEDEQAAQATQEAEALAAEQAEEDTQAEEVTPEPGEEVVEPESEAEEAAPEETEDEAAGEVTDSEGAVPTEEAGVTPDTEEEAPAAEEAEETPTAEEEAEAVEAAEGEAEVSEEEIEEAAAEEPEAEEVPAEEEAEETEAEESVPATLPATHTVAPGENLFRIGLKYGLSWIPLAIYNDIPNPNLIYTGQVIRIPGGQAPPTETAPEGADYTNYVVKPGDTVYKISRAFGVSPQEIVEVNGLVNPNLIYAGQVLKIPTG